MENAAVLELEAAMDLPRCYVIVDQGGKVVSEYGAAYPLTGRNWRDVIDPEDLPAVDRMLAREFREPQWVWARGRSGNRYGGWCVPLPDGCLLFHGDVIETARQTTPNDEAPTILIQVPPSWQPQSPLDTPPFGGKVIGNLGLLGINGIAQFNARAMQTDSNAWAVQRG
ncbi:MAG: hypothetical protein ACYTBJ_16100 [Planctomycetota bacterium]|jgi:hypothetical protein